MPDESTLSPIRAFLGRSFHGRQLSDEEDIFALGFGNSLFAMQLVDFLERHFSIEIDSDDLEMKNFRTVCAIAYFIEHKLGAPNGNA